VAHKRDQDHFGRKAKSAGYAARSVYKLEEIQNRFHIFPRDGRVLDLGCSPGSWSVLVKEVGGADTQLVGVDLVEVGGFSGHQFVGSVFDVSLDELRAALGGGADFVMSDMAPDTSGNRFTDHVRQIELAEQARVLASELLVVGGNFVVKVFEGEDAPALVERIRADYTKTKRVKPKATRKESVEFFVVGIGRKRRV
jgi:23S rRNA (uridine2552-2'-O)-methyltransferase